jgi:hypothetical protein
LEKVRLLKIKNQAKFKPKLMEKEEGDIENTTDPNRIDPKLEGEIRDFAYSAEH